MVKKTTSKKLKDDLKNSFPNGVTRLQSMYNHMVGRASLFLSPLFIYTPWFTLDPCLLNLLLPTNMDDLIRYFTSLNLPEAYWTVYFQVKLTYFDLYGRGEIIRLLLKHAGIEFEVKQVLKKNFWIFWFDQVLAIMSKVFTGLSKKIFFWFLIRFFFSLAFSTACWILFFTLSI